MRRQGRVVSLDSDAGALVELESVAQCRRCSRGEGCGAMLPQAAFSSNSVRLHCTTQLDDHARLAQVGQQVLVEIDNDDDSSSWLWLVFGTYGLPLLCMFVATAFATFLTEQTQPVVQVDATSGVAELIVLLAAVSGLCGGFFIWRSLLPYAQSLAQQSLCLQSARIVAVSLTTQREL